VVPQGARSQAGKSIYGKVIVKNRSYDAIDVYWSLNDDSTPWFDAGFLPRGWKLKVSLVKFNQYLLAGETFLEDDGYWDWGPRAIFLRKKFTWTLLP
jgi:hypothetical protein